MEHLIHNGLAKLCALYSTAKEKKTPLYVSLIYRALMADVICEYAFGKSWNFLDNLEYSKGFFSAIQNTLRNIFLFRESKFVNWVALSMVYLPNWLFSGGNMKDWTEWSEV